MIEYPIFASKEDFHAYCVKNQDAIIRERKKEIKYVSCYKGIDGITGKIGLPELIYEKSDVNKQDTVEELLAKDEITASLIINTTNLMDAHLDVHLPGLWDKSLIKNKNILHLQEHRKTFDHVISDGEDLKTFVKNFSWSELGFSFTGTTQALMFESKIRKDVNEFMFGRYAKGKVKQHSVGMRYVTLVLAVNNPDYGANFEAWEKYFPIVANQETAEDQGMFWIVKEAELIEGSAVVLGSNFATPTIEVKIPKQITQTSKSINFSNINIELN